MALQVDELGYKYNLTDVAASIGLQQLSELDLNHAKRKKIAQSYDNLFDRIPSIDRYHYDEAYKHAYHLYIINIRSDQWSISRNELINEINGYGIGTSVHYIPHFTLCHIINRSMGIKIISFQIAQIFQYMYFYSNLSYDG